MLSAVALSCSFYGNAAPSSKQQICHVPPDNPSNTKIISVAPKAAENHKVEHGDLNLDQGESEGPVGSALCSDGIDNDCNQLTDSQDPGCARPFKYVFTTSTSYTGNLGGLAGADQKCNAVAAAAQLNPNSPLIGAKPFTAWLSIPDNNAIDRVGLGGPSEYRLLDGTSVVFPANDTAPYQALVPPNQDENGNNLSATVPGSVWTSTNANGVYASGPPPSNACTNYTESNTTLVRMGLVNIDQFWTDASSGGYYSFCNYPQRLYCFEDQDSE